MAIAKKQFEVEVIARIVATDTDGTAVNSNFDTIIDELVINGVEADLTGNSDSGLEADSAEIVAIADAVQAAVVAYKETT